MLTAPRATEMPSVYLWIYLLSKSFNWEDDSKINILERCQLHPPPLQFYSTSPALHLVPVASPILKFWMAHKRKVIFHREDFSSGLDSTSFSLCFYLLCLASLTGATLITRQGTLFAVVVSSSDDTLSV